MRLRTACRRQHKQELMKLTQQLKSASISTKGGEKESDRLKKDLDKSRQVNMPGCSPDCVLPLQHPHCCIYYMQPMPTMLRGLYLSACLRNRRSDVMVNCKATICLTAFTK